MGKKTTSCVLTSIVLGAAAGLIAGILIAPDKGKNTRKKIKDKANDLNGNLKNSYHKYKDELKDGFDKYKKELNKKKDEFVDRLSDSIDSSDKS